MLRPLFVALTSILALAAGQTSHRCFINNDWRDGLIVPGQPNVLIWEMDGANRDVLLYTGVGADSAFAGAIARNVSQGSVFWVPPLGIASGNFSQEFAIQLWNLSNQMGCSSPSFKFAKVDETATTSAAFYGPFVTTAISVIGTGYVTATATVATYQSDTPTFEQQITGSITATDGVSASATVSVPVASAAISTSEPPSDSGSGPSNTVAIAVGTVGGVLVVALIVLSILLFRARRKRADEKARARSDTLQDPKEISPMSTPDSERSEVDNRPSTAAEVSGDTARHEMMGSSTAPQELPSENMAPVELPADEIGPPPSYPGHEEYEVSPTSGGSGDSIRRSLSFDKGTFTVSPLSRDRDRKE